MGVLMWYCGRSIAVLLVLLVGQEAAAQGRCYGARTDLQLPRRVAGGMPLPTHYTNSMNLRRPTTPAEVAQNPVAVLLDPRFARPQPVALQPAFQVRSAFDAVRPPTGGSWGIGGGWQHVAHHPPATAGFASGDWDPPLLAPPVGMLEQLATDNPGDTTDAGNIDLPARRLNRVMPGSGYRTIDDPTM